MVVRARDKKVRTLKRVPLFAGLSGSALGQIARIADEIDLREGKELIREGSPGRQFFVLLDGAADVRRKGRKINSMRAGDFFGEIALMTDRPATATVTLSEDSRALVITRPSFRRLMREQPSVNLQVLEALTARLPQD